MTDDKRRCALVTGGGRGIGRAITRCLLHDGWAVTIADVDREAGPKTEAEFAAIGPCLFHQTDVRQEDDVKNAVAAALVRFGRIDGLVNNAGIAKASAAKVTELALADWNRIVGANLTGAFLCAKHAAPHLRAAKGAVVNIASTRALMSEPDTEAYAASKGGLVALTHALAISLGPEVRVNCVSPGWIDTRGEGAVNGHKARELSAADHAQHPAGRVGRPDDIAEAVAYLLGDHAGFITGANLVIDGGMTRKMIYV
ncbi:MAG: glucose 1-dehydrogenase [Acidimicrobiia bacterium]|nr:glucose 1-dehydrogenase [Acidimicrobiia bacterium]